MHNVCILDYGSGNVRSVLNAFSSLANCRISNNIKDIQNSSHLILPGVGSYKNSMRLIRERIPIEELKEQVKKGKPLLGICVGMQVLGKTGIEFEEEQGLSFFQELSSS